MELDWTDAKPVDLEELEAKVKELAKQKALAGSAIIKDHINALFLVYPDLKSFVWSQYTPGYCDGGECEFGVALEEINGKDFYEYEAETEEITKKTTDAIESFLDKKANVKTLQECFGEDIRVRVTRDKIVISMYTDHD